MFTPTRVSVLVKNMVHVEHVAATKQTHEIAPMQWTTRHFDENERALLSTALDFLELLYEGNAAASRNWGQAPTEVVDWQDKAKAASALAEAIRAADGLTLKTWKEDAA